MTPIGINRTLQAIDFVELDEGTPLPIMVGTPRRNTIIAIPALVLLFRMTEQAAQGTALVMVLPSAVLGFWKYRQRNAIDLRMAALLCSSAALARLIHRSCLKERRM
jgi:hypothetical protein